MIPDRPPEKPPSERKTYLALQDLPDEWTVIHSVAWQAPRRHRQHDGEADFVLLHPNVGLIVLEVKGGGIEVSGGHWRSIDGRGIHHDISDPIGQARESKHALLAYLQGRGVLHGFLPMGHGAVLPDISTVLDLGPAVPPGTVLIRPDLTDPLAAVQRLGAAFDLQSGAAIDITPIVDALAPVTTVRHLLADDIAQANARLIRLTDEQVGVLHGLRRNRRALILGGAGTGKTVLAREKAIQLANEGARVLLTCFNKPLADHLEGTLAGTPGIQVGTFHAYCRAEIVAAGLAFPDDPPQGWWDGEAPAQLAMALEAGGHRVDAVVLDEGQDFAPDWFSALHLALDDPEQSPFYVFADTHQAIYRDDWQPPFEDTVFELDRNCRNTLPIAERVVAIFGEEPPREGAPGLTPEFHTVENEAGAIALLPELLHGLVNLGGLDPGQVAVLTQAKALTLDLRGRTVAGQALGDADAPGVTVETIHRFKGLEADAAIVLLDHIDKDRHRSLAYIGLSRARSHLIVVGTEAVRDAIGWSGGV